MVRITEIDLVWELHRAGISVSRIARQMGKHRATVYRWLAGFRLQGLQGFVRSYQNAKKGRRRRKVYPMIEKKVLALREQHRDCCGEKIVYWLAQEGIALSRATVYRILNKHLVLRAPMRRNRPRGPVPQAEAPREVIQMDTVDLGRVYAYTAIDIYTREAQGVFRAGLSGRQGRLALEKVMGYFGRCEILQTDGGHEFGGEFEGVVRKYAGRHRRARPYRKNEQAFVESFNRTLRKECVGWVKYRPQEIGRLQHETDRYLKYYHYERPHLGLGLRTPLSRGLSHLL